ncbi:MAG TPA: PHP domain-containing protein [Gemmatimonadaceae bacterium]|nr:PHP domain-containing protein [Gemmatimonadaceae bacterium]
MTEVGDAAKTAGFVDLHSHSTASDGILPPDEVIAAAHKAGLKAVALTDHDTLAGVPLATITGETLGIRVVPGVELSANDSDREIHLLALHVTRLELLESRLETLRAGRTVRASKIVERLRELGAEVTVDMVMAEAGTASVGRPHIARAMIRAGTVRDFREAFDRYLGAGRAAFIPKERLEIADAIAMTHEAGGIAVWAHPGYDGRRERLEPLVAAGLDGVEVRHPSHDKEDIKRLAALAEFFGLVASGGSDWHGLTEGPRTIGSMQIPEEWLAKQDILVASRQQPVTQQ